MGIAPSVSNPEIAVIESKRHNFYEGAFFVCSQGKHCKFQLSHLQRGRTREVKIINC